MSAAADLRNGFRIEAANHFPMGTEVVITDVLTHALRAKIKTTLYLNIFFIFVKIRKGKNMKKTELPV